MSKQRFSFIPPQDDEDRDWTPGEVAVLAVLCALMLLGMIFCDGCSADPAAHYTGPSVSISAGYAGATAGIAIGTPLTGGTAAK